MNSGELAHDDRMTDSGATRVAVYFDFDNIVISHYDHVHGRNAFQRDKAKGLENERLQSATVDLGAIMDFASSFGTLVLTRAYADWSADVNARYHSQLVARAVDLVQLFPATGQSSSSAQRQRPAGRMQPPDGHMASKAQVATAHKPLLAHVLPATQSLLV